MMLNNSEVSKHISQPYDNHEIKVKKKMKKTWFNRRYQREIRDQPERREKLLRRAALYNDVHRVEYLLKAGVNPNSPDDYGRTAMHLACSRGYTEVVKCLLWHNANCNTVDNLGNTPLHLAVCTTSSATVSLLLKAGSSVTSIGKTGVTPIQMAQSRLWLLQRHTSHDYDTLKSQVSELLQMMKKLLEEQSAEAQLVEAFSSRLSLTQTKAEVTDDLKNLLGSLSNLELSKPEGQSTQSGSQILELQESFEQLYTTLS